MPLFVTSTSSVNRHGAFAIARTPPSVIRARGTGVAALVGQFPWGPMQSIYEPATMGEAINTLAPRGMTRTGSAYLSLIKKAWPVLRVVRVVGAGAVKASRTLSDVVPTVIVTLTAKYEGTAGNSITATVANASDGDATHFNLTIAVTGTSGTTSELYENLNYSGTGTESTPTFTDRVLLGAITKNASGRPLNGSSTFGSGTSPAVISSDYVGTAGAPDTGISLLEGDTTIRQFCTDDQGATLRDAVNAGSVAHALLMGNRIAYINGDSGLSAADTRTDKASYSSIYAAYLDPWVYVLDDVDGTERLVPPGPFGCSVSAQVSPSTSIAWKNVEVQEMLSGISRLAAARGAAAGTNTDLGIATLIREETGGHTIEAGVLTVANADIAKKNITRTRMGVYIADAFQSSIRGSVDAPNVPRNQDDLVMALDTLLSGLKRARNLDPNHTPFINDYSIASVGASNTEAEIQGGTFTLAVDVQTGSAMERIFLSINFGETVTVTAQL